MAENLDKEKQKALLAFAKARQEQKRLEQEALQTGVDMTAQIKAQRDLAAEQLKVVRKLNQTRLDGLKSAESSLGSMSGIYQNLNKFEKERIKNTFTSKDLTIEQTASLNKMAEINRSISQLTIDDIAGHAALNQEYKEIQASLGNMSEEDKKIIENLKEQNTLARNYGKMTKTQKDFLGKQIAVYDGIKDTIGGILETASLLTSNFKGALGAAIIGVGFGLDKWGKSVRSFGGYVDSAQISTFALGFAFKDAEETAKGLSKEFGGLKDVSFTTQLNTNLMATNMGISGAEAANVVGNFARMNDGSASTAMDMAATTKALGKAAGVPIDSLMKDVAGSTKAFAEYGKNGGLNMSIAAVAAAKMGVSMDSMAKVSDSLLDFETSINNEMELGAMMGKQLNLDRARGLAYEGNMTGAVKETLNQLGGIDAFNKMDIFQKRKAAELLGLSVDEFQKMAANSDKISENGEASVSKWSTFWEGTTAFVTGPLAGMAKTFGSSLIAMGQMSPMLKDMGINMGGMAKQAFEWVKNLIKGKAIAKVTDSVSGKATDAIKDKATSAVKDKMGGIAQDKIKGGATPDPDKANKMGKINGPALIQAAAAMLIMAAALWVFAKAAQEFSGKIDWGNVFIGIAAMAALGGVAALLSLAGPMILVGAAALLIASAAFYVFGLASQQVAIGMNMLGPALGIFAAGMVAFAAAPYIQFAIGMAAVAASMLVLGAASPFMMMAGAGLNLVGGALNTLAPTIPMIVEQMAALSQISFLPILGLAGSLTMLAGALAMVAMGGLLALPILMALNGLSFLTGGGEGGGGGKTDSTAELISEIKGLRADLNAGKISVHMDGQKVTSKISAVVAKSSTNSYAKQ
jgi:hypothetical protein